jgi:glutamyl-Q tRNA(Asp) synthetase
MDGAVITRFAPSPSGYLHLGHAYSGWVGYEAARREGGKFLLRIEDIDTTRCRTEFEMAILEDLAWLGLEWEQPVRRQSEHLAEYVRVTDELRERGLAYPCFCTRKEIAAEIERAGAAPHGSEGPLYPGICRNLSPSEREDRLARGEGFALRLDLEKAMAEIGTELRWYDRRKGWQAARPDLLGDAVLARKDIGTSYHVAVVVDDALQEVTLVTRGEDLFESTHLHRVLQEVLGLPVPEYAHHGLITDAQGKRLAKRDEAETLRGMRERGVSASELRSRF